MKQMTPTELTEALDALGLKQPQAAALLGVGLRTINRWAREGNIPMPAAILIRLLRKQHITGCALDASHIEEARDG